ncbi:MAG: hypothetical protein CME64_06005 [Halobacteriovoraceae bacterium]|nr:hypothetical protein [Halobacteriovoraceae bacterium]|tara:strand:+ start:143428 stop:143889 length:462 start_codon:yes stop_codon:yes gene_type:complete
MRTDFTTLTALATHTINHLKQDDLIEYEADKRSDLIDALATELGVSFSTDEDIRDQAIEEVEEKFGLEEVPEDITETEMFNHARKEIIKSFQGENIGGLYMVESLHNIAKRVKDFLLTSDTVEEVYSSDDELIEFLVAAIRRFNPKSAHQPQL